MIKEAASSAAGVATFAVLLCLASGWILNQRPSPAAVTVESEVSARERQVSFENGDIQLAGTLALPDGSGPFPAVVLISGAGAQDRDGEMFGKRRHVVMSEALTAAGIAVLRTDDRGTGESTGDSITASFSDLAEDTRQAIRFLKAQPDIDAARVGLLGSSQGSAVAPLAAVENPEVAFVVLLSCLGLPGHEVWVDQNLALARASGMAEDSAPELTALLQQSLDLRADGDSEEVRRQLRPLLHRIDELIPAPSPSLVPATTSIEPRVALFLSPAFGDLLDHDPRPMLERLRVPALIVYGELDFQVDPSKNLPPVREALERGGHDDYRIELLPGLNHFLQPAETGLPNEYPHLQVAYAPEVLELISSWVRERFGVPL